MQRGSRYFFGSCVLTAALALPVAIRAASIAPAGQDDRDHHDDKDKRVYDRAHNDYHLWDDAEERRYHEYITERHLDYRPFNELKAKDQAAYWNWRHQHPDDNHR